MERVIIVLSSLTKENWYVIYQFIRSIVRFPDYGDDYTKCFTALNSIATLRLNTSLSENDKIDVVIPYGEELEAGYLPKSRTCFSIIYQKNEKAEDFAELVPFLLLQHEFGAIVTLGIDIDDMTVENQQSYKFKISEFLILFEDYQPVLGSRSLYLINEKKINKQTGELSYSAHMRATSLAGKGISTSKQYTGETSRRFLSLMPITESNYNSIFGFGSDNTSESKEVSLLRESVEKIMKLPAIARLKSRNDVNSLGKTESLFGQWLIAGFLYSHSKDELKEIKSNKLNRIQTTIQLYESSVFELVQNIMFHGGKNGLFYCVFDKKMNVSSNFSSMIPNFTDYSEDTRFLRMGIFDFGDKGIVETYRSNTDASESELMALKDFFDMESVATTGLTTLEMRYAARLGIKTFVKTVINHGGYFSVESNITSSGRKRKLFLQTNVSDNIARLGREEYVDFADGTHYEIIIPVVPQEVGTVKNIPLQQSSLLNNWYLPHHLHTTKSLSTIESVPFPTEELKQINSSTSKDEQKTRIIALSKKLISQYQTGVKGEIALDMKCTPIDHRIIFKILAYLQLSSGDGYNRIYLVNAQDSFVEAFFKELNPIIEYGNGVNVWSRSSAIILISVNLHVKIIWGKKKEELWYLNREIQRYYCNYFFSPSEGVNLLCNDEEINDSLRKMANTLIAPYDILITTNNGGTLFEEFMVRLLQRNIISDDLGCLVNHENTYIGSKIIVRNYYEADMLFQNNFFIERFAYLLSCRIKDFLYNLQNGRRSPRKKLVLIGYQHYSEYLLKSVRKLLGSEDVLIILAHENRDISGKECSFDFNVGTAFDGTEQMIFENIKEFYFITIVPIGSTLSTNDKIISLFKQWYKLSQQDNPFGGGQDLLTDSQFVYNHCVIIVRNSSISAVTPLESEQKWKTEGLSVENRTIETTYNNAHTVHYNILVSSNTPKQENNWVRRLNREISYPLEWQKERYVNYTENTSINSQNLMWFPIAVVDSEKNHQIDLERIFELRHVIRKGHIDVHGNHHRYYIDTESFVKQNANSLAEWLKHLRNQRGNLSLFHTDKLNVIVTPNPECESDYVRLVNDTLFGGTALIVFLDIRNWRNNIVHKLSFLKDISPEHVQYHYVDHALLSGYSYYMVKSYLFSILGYQHVHFISAIAIVNRLSYAKTQELKHDVRNHLFTYTSLLYPSNKDGHRCDLCNLSSYYDDLLERTVLESCAAVIKKNQDKLILNKETKSAPNTYRTDRIQFLRLILTHELYYRISETVQKETGGHISFASTSLQVEKTLNILYDHLTGNIESSSMLDADASVALSQLIGKWYGIEDLSHESKLGKHLGRILAVDKKISFLKVISSPPLSQYIYIRKYAYGKLLDELYNLINKQKEECEYSDLRIAKAILKSLSFLKSNALVRNDVLVGVWNLLSKVINNLDYEREYLKILLRQINNKRTILEWRIKKKKEPSYGNLFPVEDVQFEKQTEILHVLRKEIEYDLLKTGDNVQIVRNFSRDLQFYVKNAILDDEAKATFLGELLRKGFEMDEFKDTNISATSLYIGSDVLPSQDGTEVGNVSEPVNKLFGKRFECGDTLIYKEYVHFLLWLFYDNTTIIRRTLDNFTLELGKDDNCKALFYDEGQLKGVKDFKSNIYIAKKIFTEKIKEEYYYHAFRPYLHNGDGIDFVEKLVYVVYAKLKLEDLTSFHHKKFIEEDTRDLMEIFSAIMGADKAFWTMNKSIEETTTRAGSHKSRRLYPISLYGMIDGGNEDKWDYDKWILNENYYTGKIHIYKQDKEIISPVVPLYNISTDIGERKYLGARSAGIFVINDTDKDAEERKSSYNGAAKGTVVATITFLYNESNPVVPDEKTFRIHLQESSRLMLLLKNIIDKYVIGYLKNEKAFDMWERKFWHIRRFEKIYANSAHRFNAVYEEMDEFDRLEPSVISKMYNTWYFLSNETISFIYSNIERNGEGNGQAHFMNLQEAYVIDNKNTFGATFDHKYRTILTSLLNSTRWNTGDDQNNKITINGQPLEQFELEDNLTNVPLPCNRHLMRTFVAQCIHNSLSSVNRHGHRGEPEVKNVEVRINKSGIYIEDIPVKSFYRGASQKNRESQFRRKKKLIRSMNCEEYSSTTLTSLQGFVNYMRDKGWNYSCDFGFNENNNFFVKIEFE